MSARLGSRFATREEAASSVRIAVLMARAGRSSDSPWRERGRSEAEMIRVVFRFVGFLSLIAAAAALAYDGVTSVFARSVSVSSVGSVWEHIPGSSIRT